MAYLPRLRKSRSSLLQRPLGSVPTFFSTKGRSLPSRGTTDSKTALGIAFSGIESSPDNRSRLQRRLQLEGKRQRTFLSTVRRKRNPVSRLRQRLNANRSQYRLWQRFVVGGAICMTLGSATWTSLFVREQVTFAGVPYRIVDKFWNDKAARDAYFVGDRNALHDRLKTLGVEEDIKDYYRDRFANEYELDQHIHQIMFDRTGYVGEAYNVNNFGQLSSLGY